MQAQTFYTVKGVLPKGFVGHIAYSTVLPKALTGVQLKFVFDKKNLMESQEYFRDECVQTLAAQAPQLVPTQELIDHFCASAKTEINVSVFFDDYCAGSAHRNSAEKEFFITPTAASEGFTPCQPCGVARVVLHVLNVLNDETAYTLTMEEYKQ